METLNMRMRGFMLLLLAMAALTALQPLAIAQAGAGSGDASSAKVPPSTDATHPQPVLTYIRPTEKTKLHKYFFDTLGPYPIIGAALAAGINQIEGTPPEWKQRAPGYGKRFGSNFGIAAIST